MKVDARLERIPHLPYCIHAEGKGTETEDSVPICRVDPRRSFPRLGHRLRNT
jgi:hypothetical protein